MSKLVGLVGWRGMVGSVLMDRMVEEKDFDLIEPLFFSTSNAGGKAPAQAKNETTLQDAFNIDALKRLGATHILAISAVGSLREDFAPGHFVLRRPVHRPHHPAAPFVLRSRLRRPCQPRRPDLPPPRPTRRPGAREEGLTVHEGAHLPLDGGPPVLNPRGKPDVPDLAPT